MFVRYHQHRVEWQAVKWIALLAIASALALALATAMASAAEVNPNRDSPRNLPIEIERWSTPIAADTDLGGDELIDGIWQAMALRKAEQFGLAIDRWNELRLPPKVDVWRHVALGEAYLAVGELASAEESLSWAKSIRSENPLVHFMIGRLRLLQSVHADEWYDAIRSPHEPTLTAYRDIEPAQKTKSICRLEALMELKAAVNLSAKIGWLDDSLVPAVIVDCTEMEPTVYDLLVAIEATNYVAESHHMLGDLYLERGSLATAESHMDQAVAEGLSVVSYGRLAKQFEDRGLYTDAFRAYLKAARQEPGKLEHLRKAWQSVRELFL